MSLNEGQQALASDLPADKISYTDLYERWEKGNWRATEIDLEEDRRQWLELSEFERRAAVWNYSLFFWGEDAVADNLSPYIDAAPREEQKYFLATQQADEARHAVLFGRFMREVAGVGDGTQGGTLEAIRPQLTWGFRKIFDRLDTMADELRRDRSKPKLAAAITLYHFVIEAGLAQAGQHFIEGYLEDRDMLPGFRAGINQVVNDEQRHIAFGVKLLADLSREDPRCRHAVADLLREVLPWTALVLAPPGWDRRYTECFGYTLEEIGEAGSLSLLGRLRAAGLPMESLPGSPPVPPDLSARELSERGLALAQAGILGPKNGPPKRDPETVELLFDVIRRSVNPEHGFTEPVTVQWDFADLDPWYVRIDDGAAEAERGRAPSPDVVLRVSYDDWVDVIAGRRDPRRMMLTGRLRPKGRLRVLLRMPRVFPR